MNSFSFRISFLVLALTLVVTVPVATAQITGIIEGTVLDQGGAVLPGASVTADSPNLRRAAVTVTSDGEGNYRVPALPAGTYMLTVELAGFATATVQGVVLPVGTTVRINHTLQLAGVEETVTVTAEQTGVRVKESSLGVDIDQTTIDNIPLKGRQFLDLVELVPGVAKRPSASDQGTTFTVFGERSVTSSFLIDGHDNNDLYTRSNSEFFVQDAIQEFKVYLTGYPAEFGRASGAVTNIVTRSGTNQWDFRGFFFIRDDAMNASNIEGQEAQTLSRVETGGLFGGPLKTDKTFIFDVFQYVREERGINIDRSIFPAIIDAGYFAPATGGEPIDAAPTDKIFSNLFKFDQQINDKNQIFATVNINRTDRLAFVPPPTALFGSPPTGSISLPSTGSDIEIDTTSANVRHTGFLRDNAFLESSVRFWKSTFRENTEKPAGAEQMFPLTFTPAFQIWVSNASGVGAIDREQDRIQWVEHFSYFADTESTGSHALKFGIDLDHVELDQLFLPPLGLIIGNTALDRDFERLGYNISAQRGERAIVEGQGPDNNRTQASTNNWAAFAQDAWEVTSGLTLNLGVRWDRASVWNASGVAGRAGFAWDIKQDQRTILRGGYGRFYDVSLLEVVQDIVELGGIQRAVQDTQTIPRGASFYNNPAIGAFGPLQFSSSRWLQNPTLFEYILPEGTELSSAGTFQIQRDGKIEVDSTIVGKGNPYIMYDLLGIQVDDPSLPPVLSYESIPVLTNGRFTPEEAVALFNEFFPHPTGAGAQFSFLDQQGPGSVYDERVLTYNFRQLELLVDRRQVFSTDNTLPYTDAFNFGIDRALGEDFSIDAEVHIRRSRNLLTRRVSNLLPVPIAGSCFENTVNGPTACLLGIENLGFLDTNAFTVALKKRFSKKYSFLGSYTFTDATDNFSTLRVPPRGAEISFLFNNMPELDEGRSLNTPRHVFVFSGLYRLPLGFDLSGVLGAQSGRPFNANGLPFDSDGDDIFDNRLIGTEKGQFSTANFFNIDLRIAKVFEAGERSAVTLLIEFFNLTNRANPFIVSQVCQDSTGDGLPDVGGCGGPGFGGNVEPLPGREVQIGVKVDF